MENYLANHSTNSNNKQHQQNQINADENNGGKQQKVPFPGRQSAQRGDSYSNAGANHIELNASTFPAHISPNEEERKNNSNNANSSVPNQHNRASRIYTPYATTVNQRHQRM